MNKNRKKSIEELKNNVVSLLNEQFKLRMQKKIGQLNKNHLFKKIRRNIARLKTIINEKIGKE
ncbi:50S ribosomal protein L29 [Candidatus Portiera aleyrodidarum]|uniref:Large ribosomal subunit protein uL29 n=1 Tax=Candidatus Portiera aleyrodidarum TV TaxID=1297582 RepID=A0A8D4BPS0_9GAMM|nr:50S ribosomal protein L29 [Candidatus Portiera aleyrodidarum]AGI27120.1 ribosomal protein L29 [Candidatus Portiera aleyrodidarum TV]CEI59090.1 50S ribosomal protein L29 [Candidatus Portiera aleyrodidarum]